MGRTIKAQSGSRDYYHPAFELSQSNILDFLAQQLSLLYNSRNCDQDLLVPSFTYLYLIPQESHSTSGCRKQGEASRYDGCDKEHSKSQEA